MMPRAAQRSAARRSGGAARAGEAAGGPVRDGGRVRAGAGGGAGPGDPGVGGRRPDAEEPGSSLDPGACPGSAVGRGTGLVFRPAAQRGEGAGRSLLPPPGCDFDIVGASNVVQLSPDGGRLAFVAVCGEDRSIWVRAMDTGENRGLGGTAGAIYPFWSADGRSLGFFAAERLKRIEVDGGAIRDLAPAPDGRGGSWSADGIILYAPDVFGVMYRIPAEGGRPEAATQLASVGPGHQPRLPHFLPDGKHFLFAQGPGARASSWRAHSAAWKANRCSTAPPT